MSEAFEKWWADEGSTPPAKGDDVETHTMKKCRIAWENGAYVNEAERDALKAKLDKIKEEMPLFDEGGLCEDLHHCEYNILWERKKVHKIIEGGG